MGAGEESTTAAVGSVTEMELDYSGDGVLPSFEFVFNSANFSDKVLRIEIVADDDAPGPGGYVGGGSITDQACRHEETGDKEQTVDSSWIMVGTPVLREKTIHINSVVLASRSPFFLKLFSNGMKESDQTHPTIRIADSEENALMELLSYMYSGKLVTTEPTLLLDILMAADKFEVLSCMRHCSKLLTSLPMTTECALLYIDHPCSISLATEVQRVIRVAKEFLTNKYKDFHKFELELMDFPLSGIEVIFSSTDIHVELEDVLYYFMLEWAHARYLDSKERREILNCRLLPLIRFTHMTCTALQKILACTDNDIDHEQVTKRITDVLLHKAYPEQMKGALAAGVTQFPERAYRFKPVKLVAYDRPCPHVIVYLDLTRQDCSRLFPSEHICSHLFRLAGRGSFLMARCEMDERTKAYSFRLWLGVDSVNGSTGSTVEYEFAARTRSSGNFVSRLKEKATLTGDWTGGRHDLFGVPWSTFIADDNLFINDVLHLRADLTVNSLNYITDNV